MVNEGRFSYSYISTGIYVEIRSLSNLRFQTQEELTRIKNRIARRLSIYFPKYKDVYGNIKAISGRMVLKAAPLPEDIKKLGAEDINQIWRNAKLRGAGMNRAKTLLSVAEHSVGSKEVLEAAGYAIVTNDSDKHNGKSRISYKGRKCLRYILYEAAISLIGKNTEFKEIHEY